MNDRAVLIPPFYGRGADAEVRAFEERYAARAKMNVAELHAWGRYGAPCDCGEPMCEGFQMTHAWEDAITEDIIRGQP